MNKLRLLCSFLLFTSLTAIAQDYKIFDEGVAKFKLGEYQAVIDLFSGLLANADRNKRFKEDLFFYRGQAYFHTGSIREAVADLDESLKLEHYNKAVIYWYKARCAEKLAHLGEVEGFYEQAIGHVKNKKLLAEILSDRAAYYTRQGKKDLAEKDLAEARGIAGSSGFTTPLNKDASTQNETSGNTSLIMKSNSPADKKSAEGSTDTTMPARASQQHTPSNSSVSMVAALAEAYKDEKRFALVIGNGSYSKEIGSLKNPVNDATDVASELRKSNFEVQLLTNATYIQIREAMRKFQEKLKNGPRDQTVGLFYYAGHGVQYQDENFLVPVDADVKFEDDIVRMCFPVQRMVLNNMENTNSRMNIIILDACRNNPFPATTRSLNQGLGEMRRARGSFIAYATAPGSVASDGQGRNGLYTQELLKALRKPGLTIEQVFKDVRMNVLHLSGEKQYTWDSSNIIGEFYFKF